MKIVGILFGLILTIHIVSSVPVDTEDNKVPNVREENQEPSERFMTEVRTYLEEHKSKNERERNIRQISGCINSGDTIALQTHVRHYWLSCSRPPNCFRHGCPRMYMTGNDWTRCWGEKFQIYRASGSGQVQVGDLVGLYYYNDWLGCSGTNCIRSTCPGTPTTSHGFASEENWYRCCGEVFKIYAKGKSNGATINSGDDIMLYILEQDRWVAQGNGDTTTTTCAGTTRPPPIAKFDECFKETFKIWKKP